MDRRDNGRRAFTRLELLTTVVVSALLLAIMVPLVGAGRSRSRELVSLSNLKTLAGAHAAYAADWSDRQFTNMNDNMGQSGGSYNSYVQQFGCPTAVVLGFGGQHPIESGPGLWAYWLPCDNGFPWVGNFSLLWPMTMTTAGTGEAAVGMFRFQNIVGFNEYINGRYMDPVFFAPADSEVMSVVGPGLESVHPYTSIDSGTSSPVRSSYMASPSAMFHPGVFGGDADAVFKSPYAFPESSLSPTVSQCLHPDLKTRLIEHQWLQSPPFSFGSVKPYFNHGADSVPMTLFFDGHTSALPVRKVLADNDAVVGGGGAKLWMDTEINIGPWAQHEGYYSYASIDETRTSFHVFTRGGILGRDVITPAE